MIMKELKLYLTEWQKRQVKDYCGRDVSVIAVPIDGGFIALYMAKIPPSGNPTGVMYLTDEQMLMVRDAFKVATPCHYLDLSSAVVSLI